MTLQVWLVVACLGIGIIGLGIGCWVVASHDVRRAKRERDGQP